MVLILAAGLVAVACRSGSVVDTSALDDRAITVASFDFPESVLLAEVYAQALEAAGFTVDRSFNLGTRELVLPALQRGLVEVVPEYAGSALEFVGGHPDADPRTTHRRLVRAMGSRGIRVLDAAPAMDQNGFAVTTDLASLLGLRTLSDLTPHASDMVLAGPPECQQRPLCLPGLRDVYGLRFSRFVPLDAGGAITVAALRNGTADVGLLFTSDPTFRGNGFVLLKDDRGLEPAENVTPMINEEALTRFGNGVAAALDGVSSRLTLDALRSMNRSVATGASPAVVARAWLNAARGDG